MVVGLAIAQSLTAVALRKRVADFYDKWNTRKGIGKPEEDLPDHLHPEMLARLSVDWVGDAAQALGAMAVPAFGFVLLVERKLGNVVSLAYLLSMILALAVWIILISTDRPDKYLKRICFGMTPLTMAVVVLNTGCAIAVSLIPSD